MILPRPPHFGQVVVVAKTPMGVCRRCCTCPLPPHWVQTSGVVPASQPLPLQVGHWSTRSTVTSFSQPKAASSKDTVTPTRMLSPRWGPLRLERAAPPKPPPKKEPKMSPRSPKSKSVNPPKPPPPPAPAP